MTLTTTATSAFVLQNGTLDTNGQTVTTPQANISAATARGLTLGASSFVLNGTGTVWQATDTTNLTFNAGTSTISITDTTATEKTFIGGGLTYATVTFSGDNITITGSNTFGTLNVNGAGLTTGLLLTAGTTQTVTTLASSGTAGNVAKLASATPGSPATITGPTQTVAGYLSITDITYTGGTLYVPNGTNGGGNSGIVFANPPSNAPSTPAGIAIGLRIGF